MLGVVLAVAKGASHAAEMVQPYYKLVGVLLGLAICIRILGEVFGGGSRRKRRPRWERNGKSKAPHRFDWMPRREKIERMKKDAYREYADLERQGAGYPDCTSAEAFGLQGENMMRHSLEDHLDAKEYVIMHDVMLPGTDGVPTQIDHLVISRYGVFVIEMKNWVGNIYANERTWVKYTGKRQQNLESPLRQNYRHVKTIADQLNIPEGLIHGMVAVSHRAKFMGSMPKDVYFFMQVPYIIRNFTEPCIKDSQVPEIAAAIQEWSAQVTPWEREHFAEILKSVHE